MSFARYFKISSNCLIASGFVALVLTGSVGTFWAFLYGSALVASWIIDTASLKRKLPARALDAVILAYLPICFVDYRQSHSLVLTAVHFVMFVATIKLLTLDSDADHAYLYFISFAQLLAASALTIDITFALSFLAFLISGVSTLTLHEMRRSNTRALKQGAIEPIVAPRNLRGGGFELFSSFSAPTMFGLTLAMGTLLLVLALPLFLLLPRLATGAYGRPPGTTRLVSGFSDRVELGTIGTIKESDAVVMRVMPDVSAGPIPLSLKWRGISLDYYDGRAWRRSKLARRRLTNEEKGFYRIERSMRGTQLQEFTFFLEALSTDVVFAPHQVLAVSNELDLLQQDAAGSLFTYGHPLNKIRYRAQSDITPPDPSLVWAAQGEIPNELEAAYLQLPKLDPRTAELAAQITHSLGNPFDKAQALESYLKANFQYSLELRGRPGHQDPLAMFLFEVKRGHCEYFATAMTIMLRQIGIPARLVNGFRIGQYNKFSNAFTVRQYDAHSWVEAYLKPYGWVEFDPTPPDPEHHRDAFSLMLMDLIDSVNLWWWEGVVNYDVWKQFRLIGAVQRGLSTMRNRIDRLAEAALDQAKGTLERAEAIPIRVVLVSVLAVLALGAALMAARQFSLGWWFRLRMRVTGRRKPARITAARYYQEALDILRARGIVRNPGQTPLEFAMSLTAHPAYPAMASLTGIYYRARFGPPGMAFDFAQAQLRLSALRAALSGPSHKSIGRAFGP